MRRRAALLVCLAVLAGCAPSPSSRFRITDRRPVEDAASFADLPLGEVRVDRAADGQAMRVVVRRPCTTDVGAGLRAEADGERLVLLVDPSVEECLEPAEMVEQVDLEVLEGTSTADIDVRIE